MFRVLLALVMGLAGCTMSPTPPSNPATRNSISASPAGSLSVPGEQIADRLPQLRLDAGSLRTAAARARPRKSSAASVDGSALAQTSAASAHTPAPDTGRAGFVLGDGDEIKFTLFGQPDMTTKALVSARGRVSLPLIDTVDIGGLSPSQAETRIADAYRAGGYFTNPQVNITVTKYRSRQISVLGEVNKPGRYPLETRTSVLDALALAEGQKPTGARVITIIRKTATGTRYQHVDTDTLVTGGQPVALNAGDIVYVPEAKRFYIYGEVQKPDAYALRPGMSVMQAIAVGGGLTRRGSDSRIEIRRKTDAGNERFRPKLTDPVKAGDVIFVKERFF